MTAGPNETETGILLDLFVLGSLYLVLLHSEEDEIGERDTERADGE